MAMSKFELTASGCRKILNDKRNVLFVAPEGTVDRNVVVACKTFRFSLTVNLKLVEDLT